MKHIRKILPYIVIAIIGLCLANLIASIYMIARQNHDFSLGKSIGLHFLVTLFCFLLGALMEWRSVVKLVRKQARMSFSKQVIPGIVILLISCIPQVIIVFQFGFFIPFPEGKRLLDFLVGPLAQSSRIQNLFAVIAGSRIIKNLIKQ